MVLMDLADSFDSATGTLRPPVRHKLAKRGKPFGKALLLEMPHPFVSFLCGAVERCQPLNERRTAAADGMQRPFGARAATSTVGPEPAHAAERLTRPII